MTKRCNIDFSGSNNKFRISRPGVDVDTATESEFLFHENYLFAQPYMFKWVACPFAGNTSGDTKSATVSVAIPNVTPTPLIVLYPVRSDNIAIFPYPKSLGTGSDTSGYSTEGWEAYLRNPTATSVDVFFYKSSFTRRSPAGAWVIVMRSPDA